MTLSTEGARQVLGARPEQVGAFHKEAFGGLAGPGSLWVLEGERHRAERRLLSPPFHASCLRGYARAIQAMVAGHTERWRPGQRVRAFDAMLDMSRDIAMRTLLGLEDKAMEEGRAVMSRLLHSVHPWIAFDARFQSWWFPPWARFRRADREFSAFVARCLQERRTRSDESHDLLGLMLEGRHEDGEAMGDERIRDELFTILFAGHETTAVALSWAIYELGRHPAVLARLRDELDALDRPDPDAIVKQPYLGAVCDETLRLHTILTEIARTTAAPLEILGYRLPAGVGIGVAVSAIHQDASIYPDPDRFIPERFIRRTYSPFEFLPFGGSHRRCLGAAFSDYQMRIALAAVVTGWEFELAGNECEVRRNIAMGPRHGVRLRLTERRPARAEPAAARSDESRHVGTAPRRTAIHTEPPLP
jgi:cytochrome P450 family 110